MKSRLKLISIFFSTLILCFQLIHTANAENIRLIATNHKMEITLKEVNQAVIGPSKIDPYKQLFFMPTKDQLDQFSGLLEGNIGRHVTFIYQDQWITSPEVMSDVGYDSGIIVILPENLSNISTNPLGSSVKFMLVEKEAEINNFEGLPQIEKELFTLTLDPKLVTDLCNASNIYLFVEDHLTATHNACSKETINFLPIK